MEELRAMLDYDPETGVFTWKVKVRAHTVVGKEAGTPHSEGYRHIKIKGVPYFAHRLAWYYAYGVEPKEQIDHINGIKTDNRIGNLREASNQQNNRNVGKRKNNKTGYKGVCWNKEKKKFRASCSVNGKTLYLGYYDTSEEAHASYVAFAREHHGDFAKTE